MGIHQKNILAFCDEDVEDLEMWYPVLRLREAGAKVTLAGPKGKTIYHGKYGVPVESDISYAGVDSTNYSGLYVPGGWAPDKMRRDSDVLRLTREFHEAGKPIGQICHAGWVLLSARIVAGFTMTSTPGIRDDLENAGAHWVDEEVVVDRNIVSGRRPPDLPAFMREFIQLLGKQ